MSGTELTLQSLRRTHFTLLALSVVIGALALLPSQDYDPGLEEVRTVQELVDPVIMDLYCRDAAESRFSSLWQDLGSGDASSGEPVVGNDVEISFTAYCPHPTADQPLAEIATYLEQGLLVDVPEPADSALIPYLRMLAPMAPLQEAFVLWDTAVVGRWDGRVALAPITDGELAAINQGEQLLDVRLRYAGPVDIGALGPAPAPAGDTAGPAAPSLDALRVLEPGNVVSLRIPGVVNQSRWPLEEIIRSSPRWNPLIDESAEDGAPALFPDLQPFWSDVSSLPPAEAALYLQSVAGEEEGRLDVAGLVISVRLLGWVGPGLLAALVLYLLLHLQHLRRIVSSDPEPVQTFPWFFFFEGPVALVFSAVTVVLLPTAASALLFYRLLDGAVAVAAWAGAAALVSAAAAVRMFTIRNEILRSLSRTPLRRPDRPR